MLSFLKVVCMVGVSRFILWIVGIRCWKIEWWIEFDIGDLCIIVLYLCLDRFIGF